MRILLGRNMPLSTDSDESSGVGGAGEWMAIFLIILSLKFVLLVFDPNLRVFMGDSAGYLHAALTGMESTGSEYYLSMACLDCGAG